MPLHALVQLGEETLGHDETRRNRIAADLRMTVLGGERGRQHFHRRLRGVGRLRGLTAEPLARPHVDDRATAASGMACQQQSSVPRRLVAMVSSETARSRSRIARWRGARCMSLALFTSRSPPPKCRSAVSSSAATDCASAMPMARAGRVARFGRDLRGAGDGRRAINVGHHHAAALARDGEGAALPMPAPAPVTTATLPSNPCHRVLLDCVVLSRHAARPKPDKAQGRRWRARHRQRRFR
ncbi:hypothetical protein ACVWW4_004244 [Bradyrhizobium sp. LB7.1]